MGVGFVSALNSHGRNLARSKGLNTLIRRINLLCLRCPVLFPRRFPRRLLVQPLPIVSPCASDPSQACLQTSEATPIATLSSCIPTDTPEDIVPAHVTTNDAEDTSTQLPHDASLNASLTTERAVCPQHLSQHTRSTI
ncbi:hypothetical protein V6N12_042537 [Hibiscus sabdariffa]|uniref:Uncharacterized protein n=1 Tax=Hibiscus sabdariffa TaxID=183260 RepID=A0ABR2EHD5_9ROSI